MGGRKRAASLRHNAQRHASCRIEIPSDGLSQRLRRDHLIALEIAREVRRVVHEHVVRVQLVGLATEASDRLQAEDELRLGLDAAAFDLLVGRAVRLETRNLVEDRVLELAERMSGRRRGSHLRIAGDLA